MGNPRRDAFEYGVLITLGTSMAAAYAFLIAYSSQRTSDGQRRKLPRVDLNDEVDIGKAWEDMKSVVSDMRWGRQRPSFPNTKTPDDARDNNSSSSSDNNKQGGQ